MSSKFEISKGDIKSIREQLTPVEQVLLENIYNILLRKKELMKRVFENACVGKYKEVDESVQELKYIDQYNSTLDSLKEQFFEHASIPLLNKIINREVFKKEWGDNIQITPDVLREFRYSSEFKISHPKAEIAKKLGAKLIV